MLQTLIDPLHNTSLRIQRKWYSFLDHKKYLRDLEKMCGLNVNLLQKYNKATQDTKDQMFLLSNWINDAMKLNQICYILADINGNANLMPVGK